MFRVIDCIVLEHDLWLVVLAGAICGLASHTAFSLFRRAGVGERQQSVWLLAAAVAMGSGVWATHFVAMLAYRTPWPLGFDIPLTAASAVVAIAISAIGLLLALNGRLAMGGTVAGIGVASMHFSGMAALEGGFQLTWAIEYVIASLALALGISAIAFRLLSSSNPKLNQFGATALYAIGVCALHFTAMAAATLEFEPSILPASAASDVERQTLAIAVAAVAALLLGSGLLIAVVDSYLVDRNAQESERLRRYVAELEATQAELKATTDSLSLALEAAAASSQAKSQFLTIMSHELRTPLNAILGFADLMKMELHGPIGNPEYTEYTESIHRSGSHLLNLINDILDFSKIDSGRMELSDDTFDLVQVLSECVGLIAAQATEARVNISAALPSAPVFIHGDRRRIVQIALNLLSNAVKFTPSDGSVKVELALDNDQLAFLVVDTGIGMTTDEIPIALEVFGQIDSRLSRNYEGTGLGLPLCKHLTELHGGRLEIDSEPGVGTTIGVHLPMSRLVHKEAAA